MKERRRAETVKTATVVVQARYTERHRDKDLELIAGTLGKVIEKIKNGSGN